MAFSARSRTGSARERLERAQILPRRARDTKGDDEKRKREATSAMHAPYCKLNFFDFAYDKAEPFIALTRLLSVNILLRITHFNCDLMTEKFNKEGTPTKVFEIAQ
jgi:hypothetical protein